MQITFQKFCLLQYYSFSIELSSCVELTKFIVHGGGLLAFFDSQANVWIFCFNFAKTTHFSGKKRIS